MPEKKKIVLFLEDDEEQIYFYRYAFEKAGWNFVWTTGVKAALTATKEKKPDIVFVDIILNHESGLDFLKQVKADKKSAKPRILVLTNFWSSKMERDCLAAGAEKYLIKTNYLPAQIVKLAEESLK